MKFCRGFSPWSRRVFVSGFRKPLLGIQATRTCLRFPAVSWQRRFCASPNGNGANDRLRMAALDKLRELYHPKLGSEGGDIIYSGTVTRIEVSDHKAKADSPSEKVVSVWLQLDESYRELKRQIEESLADVCTDSDGTVAKVRVHMAAEKESEASEKSNGLSLVKRIVAVSSCKGGVGKSTVAVNLAFALSRLGQSVGIFDADIYGPSLPTMVSVADDTVRKRTADGMLLPIECIYQITDPSEISSVGKNDNGAIDTLDDSDIGGSDEKTAVGRVLCMSFGFVRTGAGGSDPESGLAAMRGPMVSQVVSDLVTLTDWGALDYLIVDLPPGTGDIHLTLAQNLAIDAAVVVSTPQRLAFVDVVKGVAMFDRVNVPCVALVENMATLSCAHCGEVTQPFGKGHAEMADKQLGIEQCFSLPIDPLISHSGDNGIPVVLRQKSDGQSKHSAIFTQIARSVAQEIDSLKSAKGSVNWAIDLDSRQLQLNYSDDLALSVDFKQLRGACQCALCVDEWTAEPRLEQSKIDASVQPQFVERKGNYAFLVKWSDKHTSLYSFEFVKNTFS